MSEPNDSFEKDLEQLIRIFKKIRSDKQNEQFAHLDKAFTQNLDFIINNYEMVKNSIPREMLSQMGLPFQKMLHEFIEQLKGELGEDLNEFEQNRLTNIPITETFTKSGVTKSLTDDIETIDMMLKKPGLSVDELNILLDERNRIIKKHQNDLLNGL
jgi:predicted DNA binding CopG/RHH family protein